MLVPASEDVPRCVEGEKVVSPFEDLLEDSVESFLVEGGLVVSRWNGFLKVRHSKQVLLAIKFVFLDLFFCQIVDTFTVLTVVVFYQVDRCLLPVEPREC